MTLEKKNRPKGNLHIHMNIKLIRNYLLLTFSVMLASWGLCALLCQVWSLSLNDHLLLRGLFFIGGMSPTIASYVSLKGQGAVSGLRPWLRAVFDVRHSGRVYGLVLLCLLLYYGLGCLLAGCQGEAPLFMALVLVPMMLLGGGNEEAGWRMILQPELEKGLGFYGAAALTGLIWWLWHGPIFLIPGTANASMNYLLFGILCLALSLGLGAVRRASGGVFPCVLLHCLINGFSPIFTFPYTLWNSLAILAAMAILAWAVVRATPFRLND